LKETGDGKTYSLKSGRASCLIPCWLPRGGRWCTAPRARSSLWKWRKWSSGK